MTGIRTVRIATALLAICAAALEAQDVSEKKEIAIFRLSTYDATVPPSILGSVDAAIQQVFVEIGRFDVLGMTYRLGRGDVQQFVDKIREYKQENIEIPQQVQMGQEFFTEADLNKILGSFLVVIPSVTNYDVEGGQTTTTTTRSTTTVKRQSSPVGSGAFGVSRTTTVQRDTTGAYHARLDASFSFVNVAEMKAVAQVDIQTDGYDDDPDMAGQEAVDDLPVQLTYEIRKIEEFKLKSGILEVDGRTVIMELGRNLGVRLGDEYEVVGTRSLASGKTYETRNGLLVVKEVSDEISIAQIIYANGPLRVGDQLKEFPLLGGTVLPYAHLVLGVLGTESVFLPGVRAVWNRGFYRFKPHAGLEVPIALSGTPIGGSGLPLNVYGGGEMDLYLGRLQINPMISLGVGGAIPLGGGSTFYLSHVGFKADLNVTLLVTDKIKVSVDGGFAYWAGLGAGRDYFGPLLGAGAEIKL